MSLIYFQENSRASEALNSLGCLNGAGSADNSSQNKNSETEPRLLRLSRDDRLIAQSLVRRNTLWQTYRLETAVPSLNKYPKWYLPSYAPDGFPCDSETDKYRLYLSSRHSRHTKHRKLTKKTTANQHRSPRRKTAETSLLFDVNTGEK